MKISMRAARANANLSIEELAEKLGKHYCTVRNWEIGKTSPTVEDFKKYCEACNVDISDIEI